MAKNSFKEAAVKIYNDAKRSGRLIENLGLDQAKAIALTQDGVIETQLGSVAANSEPMSRAAPHTKNSVDSPFGEEEELLAQQAVQTGRTASPRAFSSPSSTPSSPMPSSFSSAGPLSSWKTPRTP